jgi:hypothetical protein
MSAQITEVTTYGWYCAICPDGADDYEYESDACIDAEQHDDDNHPPREDAP